ncbi:MAG: hypothetical protein IT462_06910 [Planctomycetes bacterium]|nr:hypothetical protein [Planctomycetota bacterium]
MEPLVTALYIIAGIFTALFVIRLGLMLLGFDHDAGSGFDAVHAGDVGHAVTAHDVSEAAQFKMFSIQTILVTLMLGSWVALACIDFFKLGHMPSIAIGAAVGFVSGVGVSYAMFSMRKLEADYTVRDFKAEGLRGTCYLRIPEAGQGHGQVQLNIGDRQRIFDAVSDGPAIDSFKPVVVMARVDEKTLRVCETQ